MMDFDAAASRLAKDQQSALARSRAQRAARTASAKAKREAATARAQAEKRLREKKFEAEKKARVVDRVIREVGKVERRLGVVDVGVKGVDAPATAKRDLFEKYPFATGWKLNPTSIHGEGDKIALPPSILEKLTSGSSDLDLWSESGRPLAFRIGILNPSYAGFPDSEKMKALIEKVNAVITIDASQSTVIEPTIDQETSQDEEMVDSDGEVENSWREAYLDELSHRYLAYTHGTVVEFTQEDECVGLPEPIARALLIPNAYSLAGNTNGSTIETKKTVDPAAAALTGADESSEEEVKMKADANDDEKTPGHPAYGLFDIPAGKVEITPIKSLPPGKDCTFTPTASSIQNGFYALKDVKAVLEQSLLRTRATLSKGDVIRTWRRGVSFDLIVSKLAPADYATDYGGVSCVNTDLNVDIGPPEETEDEKNAEQKDYRPIQEKTWNGTGGRTLGQSQLTRTSLPSNMAAPLKTKEALPPEPPKNVTAGVCTVQIRARGSSSSGRRRFKTNTTTIGDLFAFASTVGGDDVSTFKLVTRFPRRVFLLSSSEGIDCYKHEDTLESAGIGEGQVLFMIEEI